MDVGVLSMRYAKALIGYAIEKGVEDAVYHDCQFSQALSAKKRNCVRHSTILFFLPIRN
jgi:F0F1-type ATP synthase delta subunit